MKETPKVLVLSVLRGPFLSERAAEVDSLMQKTIFIVVWGKPQRYNAHQTVLYSSGKT